MQAYVIAIPEHYESIQAMENTIASSKKVNNPFELKWFKAVTPDQVDDLLKRLKVTWNYPWVGEQLDFASGLIKSAYKTANPKARIACALSHYMCWTTSVTNNTPLVILEHDAVFTNRIDFDIMDTGFDILGINNPLGCTRKARQYHDQIISNDKPYMPVPWIDSVKIPQGLAGNSAYIITPKGAKKMIELVSEYGMWPNDALMCRQLVPRLGVTKKFYTTRQQTKSTTTL